MPDEDVLERLNREVLSAGRGASLPSRLSDEWLELASISVEDMLEYRDENDGAGEANHCIGVALLLKTLEDKYCADGKSVTVPWEKVQENMMAYLIELSLEEVSRKSEFRLSQATLETIFEPDRQAEVSEYLPFGVG